jgi:hypothetical protein
MGFLKSFQANSKHLLKCIIILIHPFTVLLPFDISCAVQNVIQNKTLGKQLTHNHIEWLWVDLVGKV